MKTTLLAQRQRESIPIYREWLTTEELSVYLNLSKSTIYKKVCNRLIPHYKREGSLYFKRSEVDAWIESGRVKTEKVATNKLTLKPIL